MADLSDVLAVLRELAPEESAIDDDPVGLLIAPSSTKIDRIGVCLDATTKAVAQAAQTGVNLVVAHHPLIYRPIRRITPETDGISASVVALVRGGIGLYAMHTNWDRAAGGINDVLAHRLDLHGVEPLGVNGHATLPRIGQLETSMTLADFCDFVAIALGCSGTSALRINALASHRPVKHVAVCGGAGAFLMEEAISAGADAYVTADVRHHEFVEATARGFPLIDAGHAATERHGMDELALILPERLVGVAVVRLDE